MKNKLFVVLFVLLGFSAWAQPDSVKTKTKSGFPGIEEQMKNWGLSIITDTLVEKRQDASKKMAEQLTVTLSQKGSFQYPFDSLKTISIQYPVDSSFRIFTWQLYVDVNQYDYLGFIQTNEEEPKVIRLQDRSVDMDDANLDYEVLEADNWYGALYYNIMSFDTPEGKKHLLFGFDGYRFFNKRKIIDVLSMENGRAVFGAAVFAPLDPRRTDLIKNRVMMQYSAETNISVNFNEQLDMIVFDYLLPHSGPGGPTYVPDGSYHGYRFKDGLWVYVDKIFDQVSETPPMPQPILGKRNKKDIFGN